MAEKTEKAKRKRASAPKVKTGCITCKIRHLKCDERKPTCQRCEKDKHVCDGYAQSTANNNIRKTPVVSQTEQQSKLITRCHVPTPRCLASAPSMLETLEPSAESQFSHHFRIFTVPELGNSLNAMDFWQTYVLPMSHRSKPVKAAICALGGAHKSFKFHYQTGPTAQSLARLYEIASVRQYNNAIRTIQENISLSYKDLREVLTCCLIFICIDNLYGRHENVTRHLEAAFSLLNSLGQSQNSGNALFNVEGARCKQDDTAEFIDAIYPSLCGLASDLFLYLGDKPPPKLVSELANWARNHNTRTSEDPNTPFTSVQAAASSLMRIESAFDVELYGDGLDRAIGTASCEGASPFDATSKFGDGETRSIALYYKWDTRFKIFQQSFDPATASNIELDLMRTLELEQATWNAAMKLKSVYDDLEITDCINILQTAETVINSLEDDKRHIFTFQGSIIPQVALVITACPDTDIQWQGVRLLRLLDRREGIWDSRILADIFTNMITAQTGNMLAWDDIPGDVPELSRLLNSLTIQTA